MKSISYENAVITTFAGLEEILAEEIQNIGGTDISIGKRSVKFTATKEIIYRANFELRTGLRVLINIHKFRVDSEKRLYTKTQEIDWLHIIKPDMTFSVSTVVNRSSLFTHTNFVALKVKDAIVDQIRDEYGIRPNVDVENPDIKIHVHIDGENCDISLETNGDSLHRRGYRISGGKAPLNEVLAAGMIMISKWKGESTFVNPMSGSGTLLIEAALIAANKAPGLLRRTFGMKRWLDFDKELWKSIRKELKGKIKEIDCKIIGYDNNKSANDIALANIEKSKFDEDIIISNKNFFNVDNVSKGAVVIMNPPYDERMREDDINEFYWEMGDTLKDKFVNSTVWIVTSNNSALRKIRLSPSEKFNLFNGKLEVVYCKYDIFPKSEKENLYKLL